MTGAGRGAALAGALALVAGAGAAAWVLTRPQPDLVQGQVEATEVDVSPKLAGRVKSLAVREGDTVRAGQEIAVLESLEVDARLRQAEAAETAARAQSDKARNGARDEEVRQARAQWERAQQAGALARVTFERLSRLYGDGVVPEQRRDEAETAWRTAESATAAARAALDMAEKGAREEDKQTAEAMVDRAAGAVDEVEAYRRETHLVAPVGGEVARRVVDAGELVSPGLPVVTLVDLGDAWVTFSLREDRLAGLRIGDTLRAHFPALGRDLDLSVYYIAPQGDFATWRATSAAGGFDLKTFEVRARPRGPQPGMRPGMTAVVAWDRGMR